MWRGHTINWTAACPSDPEKANGAPTVVLVHGFGESQQFLYVHLSMVMASHTSAHKYHHGALRATRHHVSRIIAGGSVYHWRRTLPALAPHCNVFALDCLGFGWSAKADKEDYSGYTIWASQLIDFIQEVVGATPDKPVVLVGNSLGGFTTMQAAAQRPDLVQALVLMNVCGAIEDIPPEITAKAVAIAGKQSSWKDHRVLAAITGSPIASAAKQAMEKVGDIAVDAISRAYFQLSKHPDSVRQSLQRVRIQSPNIPLK